MSEHVIRWRFRESEDWSGELEKDDQPYCSCGWVGAWHSHGNRTGYAEGVNHRQQAEREARKS